MRSAPRWLLAWTSLVPLALTLACETTTRIADAGESVDARTVRGADDPALEHPAADAATPQRMDATAPAPLDAGVDAHIDGSTAATDAGAPHDTGTPPDAAASLFVCNGPAPASCPAPAPRYPEIAAIIKLRCASCHSPLWTGPWPLDTYGHVADWQDTIQSNLLDCTMPPPDAGVPITAEERVQILTWIKCGLPQ